MRALVVGASGLVGSALVEGLREDGIGTYRSRPRPGLLRLDATDRAAFARCISESRADVIFLPAAEANVDWCEQHPEEARRLNLEPVDAAIEVADGRRIVAYSSDYVFDGEAGPYREPDPPHPLSVYGAIKLEIESRLLGRGHTIVRTTTVFGHEEPPAKNFVLRLVASLGRGETARVPADQVSTPTYADDLARASIRIAGAGSGIWHVAGPDLVDRAELARRAARAFGLPSDGISAVATADLSQAARRPLRGGLLCDRYAAAFGAAGRPLDEALRDLRARTA